MDFLTVKKNHGVDSFYFTGQSGTVHKQEAGELYELKLTLHIQLALWQTKQAEYA